MTLESVLCDLVLLIATGIAEMTAVDKLATRVATGKSVTAKPGKSSCLAGVGGVDTSNWTRDGLPSEAGDSHCDKRRALAADVDFLYRLRPTESK